MRGTLVAGTEVRRRLVFPKEHGISHRYAVRVDLMHHQIGPGLWTRDTLDAALRCVVTFAVIAAEVCC